MLVHYSYRVHNEDSSSACDIVEITFILLVGNWSHILSISSVGRKTIATSLNDASLYISDSLVLAINTGETFQSFSTESVQFDSDYKSVFSFR